MVLRSYPYTCDCCKTVTQARFGENRRIPEGKVCGAPCPACDGPCEATANRLLVR